MLKRALLPVAAVAALVVPIRAGDPLTDQLIHTGSLATGTVSVSSAGDVYSLTYDGTGSGDELIEYRIDVGDPDVFAGIIRVYEASSDSYPIFNGGPDYRNAKGTVLPAIWMKQFGRLVSATTTADSLILDYNDNVNPLGEGIHRRRHTFQLVGKTLRIRVQARLESATDFNGNSNYAGFHVGATWGTEDARIIQMQGGLTSPLVMFENGPDHWFMANVMDLYNSNASSHSLIEAHRVRNPGSAIAFYIDTQGAYLPDSAGNLSATLDDTWVVTVSQRVRDVLLRGSQGPSPYRSMMTNKMVVLYNSPPSAIPLDFFDSMGMTNIAFYIFNWSGSPCEPPPQPAPCNTGPDWYPAASALGALGDAAETYGHLFALYTAYSVMHPNAGLPAGTAFDASAIAKRADGTNKLSAQLQNSFYMLASSAAGPYAEAEATLLKNNYKASAAYVDIQTYASPARGADGDHIDQTAGSPWAKTLRQAIIDQKTWMQNVADIHLGPIIGEGSIASQASSLEYLWAGYADSLQRVINTGSGLDASDAPFGHPLATTNWPVIPEYELRVFRELQANHGNGFTDRFFGLSDGPEIVRMTDGEVVRPLTDKALDRYRVYEVTYGKTAFVGGENAVWTQGDRAKEYYMLNALQQRYFDTDIVSIEYLHEGVLKTFETILFQTETTDIFRDPRIKIVYANGLEVYVNHNPAPWSIDATGTPIASLDPMGTTYVIPEDGFLAFDAAGLVVFSAIAPSSSPNRIDYVLAPGQYELFDGRRAETGYGGITCGNRRLKVVNQLASPTITLWEANNDTLQKYDGLPIVVTSLILSPTGTVVDVGDTKQMRARAIYDNAATEFVTTCVTWSSSNTSVATIDASSGLATAVGSGTTQISCSTFGGQAGTPVTLTVN